MPFQPPILVSFLQHFYSPPDTKTQDTIIVEIFLKMFELLSEGQESDTVSCHDRPPQYDSCEQSKDLLTSVIENEHSCRRLFQQLNNLEAESEDLAAKIPNNNSSYLTVIKYLLELVRLSKDFTQTATELANAFKERAIQNTDLYIAMSRLSDSEFDRTYTSLKRDVTRNIRHELAQDHKDRGDGYQGGCGYNDQPSLGTKKTERAGNYACDPPSSYGSLFEVSAKVDNINDQLGQSLQSHNTATVLKRSDSAPLKPPRGFWRKIWSLSSRL